MLGSEFRKVIVDAFAFAVEHERIYLRAFAVMPDHWHALIGLREPWTLPKFMHTFMSHVGARISAHLTQHETGWQDGYYETLIKTARQFTYVAIYVEENPVKKGLVATPERWIESSAVRNDLVTDAWPWVFDSQVFAVGDSGHKSLSHVAGADAPARGGCCQRKRRDNADRRRGSD